MDTIDCRRERKFTKVPKIKKQFKSVMFEKKRVIFDNSKLSLSEGSVRMDNIQNNWTKFDTLQDQKVKFLTRVNSRQILFQLNVIWRKRKISLIR